MFVTELLTVSKVGSPSEIHPLGIRKTLVNEYTPLYAMQQLEASNIDTHVHTVVHSKMDIP